MGRHASRGLRAKVVLRATVGDVPDGEAPAASPRQQQQRVAPPSKARVKKQPRKTQKQGRSSGRSSPSGGAEETLTARDLESIQSKRLADSFQLQLTGMLDALPPQLRERALAHGMLDELDERVAPFHIEFEQARGWPAGCDAAACRDKLLQAYERCRGGEKTDVKLLKEAAARGFVERRHIDCRLGAYHPPSMLWLESDKPIGDMRQQPNATYNQEVFHSFSNHDSEPALSLMAGSTHVAVGFVDLGTLRDAVYEESVQPGPLRWVGVEASPYAVAKTAVLDAMLRAQASAAAILEVWYSAAWSTETLTAFRAAVSDLLQCGGADNEHGARARHPDVSALLEAWRSADVSLSQARTTWLEELPVTCHYIGSLACEADRLALCGYMLTGQLLDGATVGSVCMFVMPCGFDLWRWSSESVFGVVPQQVVCDIRRNGAPDIVTAAAEYLRGGVQRILDRIAGGQLTIELRLEHLSVANGAALARIATLQPRTISWNNVCDYAVFEDFHAMARACSSGPDGAGTIHYGYSMNWTRFVKGCGLVDWLLKEEGVKHVPVLHGIAVQVLGLHLDATGGKPYVIWPPVCDVLNHVDWLLRIFSAPPWSFRARWQKEFFDAAQLANPETQVAVLAGSGELLDHTAHDTASVRFVYSYDPTISLVQHSE